MKGRTILLADDDVVVQAAVGRAASAYGYEVISVLEGFKVTPTAATERPDLIILDLSFPDADGREILKELKANAATRGIPVVIWSGHEPGPHGELLLTLGAADQIEKCDAFILLARVKPILLREPAPLLPEQRFGRATS